MSQSQPPPPDVPPLAPPHGITPDLTSPYTLQPYQVLTVILCIIATTLAVAARMYTKLRVMKIVTWEDCTAESRYRCPKPKSPADEPLVLNR